MKVDRTLIRAITIAAVAAVIGGVGGVGIWLAFQPRTVDEEPLTEQPVVLEPYASPISVSLKPVYAPPLNPRVYATGTVRQFDCATGIGWVSGESVITVDDSALRNLVLPRPPWRSLAMGDRGEDVKELQQALGDLGFTLTSDGIFGSSTRDAWRAFVADKTADGAALEDFVWVPAGFVPHNCDLSAGDVIGGTTIPASGSSSIVSFTVSGLPANDGTERTVIVGGQRIPLANATIDDPTTVASLVAEPVVTAALATEDAAVAATVERSVPIEAARVAASAVIIDGERACVASGTRTYDVTIIDSALGRSIVTFNGDVPRAVTLDHDINRC